MAQRRIGSTSRRIDEGFFNYRTDPFETPSSDSLSLNRNRATFTATLCGFSFRNG